MYSLQYACMHRMLASLDGVLALDDGEYTKIAMLDCIEGARNAGVNNWFSKLSQPCSRMSMLAQRLRTHCILTAPWSWASASCCGEGTTMKLFGRACPQTHALPLARTFRWPCTQPSLAQMCQLVTLTGSLPLALLPPTSRTINSSA
jgi:hypothetical protein